MNELFITKINIKHVRHLRDIEIALSETERKHLILTGKNGSGKTSILQQIKADIANSLSKPFNQILTKNLELFFSTEVNLKSINLILSYFEAQRKLELKIPKGITLLSLATTSENIISQEFLQYLVNLQAEKLFSEIII